MRTCNPDQTRQKREAGTGSNVEGVGQALRIVGVQKLSARQQREVAQKRPRTVESQSRSGVSATHTQLCGLSSLGRSTAHCPPEGLTAGLACQREGVTRMRLA